MKCYSCAIMGHLAKDSMRKKAWLTGIASGGKKRTSFARRKPGDFAKDCKLKNGGKYAETTTAMPAVHTAWEISLENREENSDSCIFDSEYKEAQDKSERKFCIICKWTWYSEGLQWWDYPIPGIWEGRCDYESQGKEKESCIKSCFACARLDL